MEEDWKTVIRKSGRKTRPRGALLEKQQSTNHPVKNFDEAVDESDVLKLCNQIEAAISTLNGLSFSPQLFIELGTRRKNSKFHPNFPEASSEIFGWREIVCYGVGSLGGAKSRVQFAIAELIRRNCSVEEAWYVKIVENPFSFPKLMNSIVT